MILKKVSHEEIYQNQEIARLISYSIFQPTKGKIQTAAQSVYSKQQGIFYVGLEDDEMVGVIGLRKVDNTKLEILHLAVDEKKRKRGFAKNMIKEAFFNDNVLMMACESEHRTVRFYKNCGFKTQLIPNEMGIDRYMCTWSPKRVK